MPIIESKYKAPLLFRHSHFSTVHASVLRKVPGVNYQRERMNLSDGDFIDLDWSPDSNNTPNNKNLVIIKGYLKPLKVLK